ncbi:MAG: tetratricopeptide repeat protein [Bacteroidales bacterium]|nr:tetratricopeptide repeat protein [Bacteroidales bacterium]
MKKDRFHDYDDELRNLVIEFESTVLQGKDQFFDVDELEMIIDYYFEVNDTKPLARAVEYAEYLYPNNTPIRLRRAHLMISNRQFAPALKRLLLLREKEPDNTDIAYSLGVAYSAMDKPEKSIECFQEAAHDGWMLGKVYTNMAEEYYKMKDYAKALRYYRKALQTDSFDDSTVYNFCETCYEQGFVSEAISEMQRLVEADPYNKEAWFCLGNGYRDMTLYERAIDAYEYAIAIDKFFIDAYIMLSQTYDLQGNLGEAVTTMVRALEYSDQRDHIYRTIGALYARDGNFATAMAYFKKALDENPLNADVLASLAMCHLHLGDQSQALTYVQKAMNIEAASHADPAGGSADVYCSAAMVYDAVGNYQMACDCFDGMIATGTATEQQYQLYVQFLYKHHNYDMIDLFGSDSLLDLPHDPFYSTYLAAAYFYTNRYNRVRKLLPDVSAALLADICPEIMTHPLLGPLVPSVGDSDNDNNNKTTI